MDVRTKAYLQWAQQVISQAKYMIDGGNSRIKNDEDYYKYGRCIQWELWQLEKRLMVALNTEREFPHSKEFSDG